MEFLQNLFSTGPYVPHGHCYLWQSGLVWLHASADSLIALAYGLISLALIYFVQRRQDVPFREMFWLFAVFIGLCGITHVLGVWTLWVPTYWLSGGIKALTALVSLWTALELIPKIPLALVEPSPLQLAQLNQSLKEQIKERQTAEAALQTLNQELEERVAVRTQALEKSQQENQRLLEQEQAARNQLETTLDNLQATAERLNIALSTAQMGSWDWEIAQNEQYWSPKTQEILGGASEDKSSYGLWRERVHPDDLPDVEAAVAAAQANKGIFSEEYRVIWPDQSIHWVLAQGRCMYSAAGNPRRMIGVIQEITKTKQAAIALQESESRFRAVFEQAAVGMARLSRAGHWLQVNQTLCDMLGYQPETLIGKSFQDVTDPADYEQDEYYYHQLLHQEIESCQFEKRYLHYDGTPIWTQVTVSTERSETDDLTAFIAVIENISPLKQAQQSLQERAKELESLNSMLAMTTAVLENRNAELDQFAYVASHDLKAPLRAIANLSSWLEEDLDDKLPEENRHQLSLLRSRVHRMEALINGLLEYSRVGRQEVRIEEVAVGPLLDNIIDSLSPPEAFTIVLPDTLPTLKTNRTALSQVFSNLINNAIKHHDREDGQIRITTQTQKDWVEFGVIDDGPGIDPKYHAKIFGIFQTLKARDELESTGIGLSLVKKIVEAEGGTLRLESSLGKGAAFYFTWHQ
jgi:PAS domain S-box-containing protein